MRRLVAFLIAVLALFAVARGARANDKPAHHKGDTAPAAEEQGGSEEGAKGDAAKGEAADEEMPAQHAPVTQAVAIHVEELNKLDLGAETYNVVFRVIVQCDKEPCKPDLDVVNGKMTGKAEKLHDDKLLKVFRIKAELTGVIDLSKYPFDNHELPIILRDKGDPEQIVYADASADETPAVKIPGWDIGKSEHEIGQLDDGDGKTVSLVGYNIVVKRPISMAVFKTIVPVLIMIFVAAFQLLLKPKSASARLSGATAGFMSIVMFQVSQVGSLPPTGYLTLFDKFMIATYIIYLANIAFAVLMVRFEEKKNERMSELMYLAAAGAVPGIALLAWTTVFMFFA